MNTSKKQQKYKKNISLFGIPFHTCSAEESKNTFLNFCEGDIPIFTATPNAEILLESKKNSELKKYLQKSSLNIPDSTSVVWALMAKKHKWSPKRAILELLFLPIRKKYWEIKRLPGADFFISVCQKAAQKKKKIFLLGSEQWVVEKTQSILQKRFSQIQIVGTENGFSKKSETTITKKISHSKAEILFVAYGSPRQELFLLKNMPLIPSLRVGMGIGGSFDFIAEKVCRAPQWMQSAGMEWLWRFLQEPKKRFLRIIRAIFLFPKIVILSQKKRKQ
jgi:N-acetylglucosaminyldiphosphoundecaprenol N-acetyl-beta-D-mannosaminyltransferase